LLINIWRHNSNVFLGKLIAEEFEQLGYIGTVDNDFRYGEAAVVFVKKLYDTLVVINGGFGT